MIEEFDKLKKHIQTDEGRKLAKEFRKRLKRSEKYADRLDMYFSLTLDGVEPEKAKENLDL